jgi:ABC-type polar amino acid transport system ATPase subunit
LAIALALAINPVAMLLDEPTPAIDPEMIAKVFDVMTTLHGALAFRRRGRSRVFHPDND